jgi:glutamate racemase
VLVVGVLACGVAPADGPSPATRDHALSAAREAWDRPGEQGPRQPERLSELPIGVFDSGTGGLAALEEILRLDAFDNRTGRCAPQGDGQPDFQHERFVFLADQANMPYGNYPALQRTGFLQELVLGDAAFLLGRRYFRQPSDAQPAADKRPVKAIAIACNTATAYAQRDVEALVAQARVPVAVLGVIDAGAAGAVAAFDGPGSIGILATQGTVASGAYPAAIRASDPRPVFQQGSLGLAGAIDGASEFVDSAARGPRAGYRGPSLENPLARIDPALLDRYGFDFATGAMFVAGDRRNPQTLQLNSIKNYVAYDVVSLVESVRRSPDAPPLGAIVLGCTHFPYVADLIAAKLTALRDYREQGRYVYRACLREKVVLVDPAQLMARRLHEMLCGQEKLSKSVSLSADATRAEFYITTPWPATFSYQYKYGRGQGYTGDDVRTVPLTTDWLDAVTAERLRTRVPATWQLLDEFSRRSAKTQPAAPNRPRPGSPP